jgi:hypothetical protein
MRFLSRLDVLCRCPQDRLRGRRRYPPDEVLERWRRWRHCHSVSAGAAAATGRRWHKLAIWRWGRLCLAPLLSSCVTPPKPAQQSIEGALPRPSRGWAQRAGKAATLPRAFSVLTPRRAFSSVPFVDRPSETLEQASPLQRRGAATAACFIFVVFPVRAVVWPPVLSRAGVPSRHHVPGWVRHRLSFLLSGPRRRRHLLIRVLNTEIEMERVEQRPAVRSILLVSSTDMT